MQFLNRNTLTLFLVNISGKNLFLIEDLDNSTHEYSSLGSKRENNTNLDPNYATTVTEKNVSEIPAQMKQTKTTVN